MPSAPHSASRRATLVRNVKEQWLIASGEGKREIVGAIRDGADVPVARVIAGRESWWFVDRAAWDPEESLSAERGRR